MMGHVGWVADGCTIFKSGSPFFNDNDGDGNAGVEKRRLLIRVNSFNGYICPLTCPFKKLVLTKSVDSLKISNGGTFGNAGVSHCVGGF